MSEGSAKSRWQSIAETLALIVVAGSVGWAAIARPVSGPGASRPPAPARRPEPPLPTQPVSLANDQILGEKTARVALLIYSDFQCPYCGKFARETLPAIERDYVKTGKVLLAFRQFPLPNHPFAEKAAEAAECAGRQGKFWPFHDQLFADPETLDAASLERRARGLNLELAPFSTCLDGQTAAKVRSDKANGEPLGVSATPTFLVGPLAGDNTFKVVQRFSGAQPLAQFERVLNGLIGAAGGRAGVGTK